MTQTPQEAPHTALLAALVAPAAKRCCHRQLHGLPHRLCSSQSPPAGCIQAPLHWPTTRLQHLPLEGQLLQVCQLLEPLLPTQLLSRLSSLSPTRALQLQVTGLKAGWHTVQLQPLQQASLRLPPW